MRWDKGHESPDVIDRRGQGGGGGGLGGILFSILPFLLRTPFGWVIIVLILAVMVGGGLFRTLMGQSDTSSVRAGAAPGGRAETEEVQFVSFVLDDTQATWRKALPGFRNAKLVLFTGSTQTSCGSGRAATGPFYCPTDERVYIDLSFFKELERRLGARGDFAQAYVIAHEIGHHVQNLNGTSDKVHRAKRSAQEGAGGLSVRLELQADCYAGMWAHSSKQRDLLDSGDIEEALTAAAAIGDDRLQKQSTGTVQPESWTHGSSAQRVRWFKRGYETGNRQACDTFSTPDL